MNGEIDDKALLLYQSALNLCADIDKQYQADATVIIVTSLTSMCTCFLSLNVSESYSFFTLQKLDQAETMAKQAYEITPTYDKAAIAMATVLVARNKYREALVNDRMWYELQDSLKPAIEANPEVNGLKLIYNKIIDMYNEQQTKEAHEKASKSVLLNNFTKKSAPATQTPPKQEEKSQMDLMKEALAKLQAEQNKPKTPEELAKEKEEEEKAAAEARSNSILWGVIGGTALIALFLFKKFHK